MLRRLPVVIAVLAAALLLVPAALAVRVHVRVEGKTRTIFGPAEPTLSVTANALDALEAASLAGEFYYHVTVTGFGPYVDQIGRYAAAASSGWVFKVNGVSPPVGADAVQLKDGDTVLWYWATFGPSGGPPTLLMKRSGRCYSVVANVLPVQPFDTMPAVEAVAGHFGDARRVLNVLTDRHLFPVRRDWFRVA